MRVDKPTLALLYWIAGSLLMGGLMPGDKAFAVEDLKHMEVLSSNSVEINVDLEGRGWYLNDSINPYDWQVSFTANIEGTSGWDEVDVEYTRDHDDGTQHTVEKTFMVSIGGWDTEHASMSISTNHGERVRATPYYDVSNIARYHKLFLDEIDPEVESSRSGSESWENPSYPDDNSKSGSIDWTVSWSNDNNNNGNGSNGNEPEIRVIISPYSPNQNPCLVGNRVLYSCLVDGMEREEYIYHWYTSGNTIVYFRPDPPRHSVTWEEPGQFNVGCMVEIGGKEHYAQKYTQEVQGAEGYAMLSSDKGMTAPMWQLGDQDPDPAENQNSQALIIPYGAVYDPDQDIVIDYDIEGSAFVSGNPGNVQWTGYFGASTELSPTFTNSGPKQGGSYLEKFLVSGTETHTWVLCPLAGADMTDELAKILADTPRWAKEVKYKAEDYYLKKMEEKSAAWNIIPGIPDVGDTIFPRLWWSRQMFLFFNAVSGTGFDHIWNPVAETEYGQAPSDRFSQHLGSRATSDGKVDFDYAYVTINGTVISAKKLNMIAWTVFSREWEYAWLIQLTEINLRIGSTLNNIGAHGYPDSEYDQSAIKLADEAYDWATTPAASKPPLATLLTKDVLRSMQDSGESTNKPASENWALSLYDPTDPTHNNSIKFPFYNFNYMLWPSSVKANPNLSSFQRNDFGLHDFSELY